MRTQFDAEWFALRMLGFAIVLLAPTLSIASVSSGGVEAGAFTARVCHDASCSTPTPGAVNFRPTGTTPITIDDTTGLNGIAWGNDIGWITLNPMGPEGLTINPSSGVISGKAWSQVSGWINFSVSGQTVSINNNGEFAGWAWTGGPLGGWIKFDCGSPSSCVKTDWRPTGARSTPTSGGATGGNGPASGTSTAAVSPSDLCANLPGIQFSTPPGYEISGPNCVPITIDVCANVPGEQSRVPTGYTQDEGGLCFLIADYCPNLPDIQFAVPARYTVDQNGSCVPDSRTSIDRPIAANMRKSLHRPVAGAEIDPERRFPQEALDGGSLVDLCVNIPADQNKMPSGYTLNGSGLCVPRSADYCPNIPGNQSELPTVYSVDDFGRCVAQISPPADNDVPKPIDADANPPPHILSFNFIPAALQLPIISGSPLFQVGSLRSSFPAIR